MSNQNEMNFTKQKVGDKEQTEIVESSRKAFVEPEISAPVDVLEATTFFQIDSGEGELD